MSVNRVLWQSDYLFLLWCILEFFDFVTIFERPGPYVKNKQWGHKLTLIVVHQNRNRKLMGRMIDVIKSSICIILPSTIFNANSDSNLIETLVVPNCSLRTWLSYFPRKYRSYLTSVLTIVPKVRTSNPPQNLINFTLVSTHWEKLHT